VLGTMSLGCLSGDLAMFCGTYYNSPDWGQVPSTGTALPFIRSAVPGPRAQPVAPWCRSNQGPARQPTGFWLALPLTPFLALRISPVCA
jgi:hypothetical protein